MITRSLSLTARESDILDPHRLTKMLAEGLDPSAHCQFGYYPLEIAALRRNVECVRLLLEAGAEPDVTPEKGRPSNVLFYATKGGINVVATADICKMLVAHGANPDGNDPKQGSPVHAAVKGGNIEAVKVLAMLGADLEVVAVSSVKADEVIGTPLRRACLVFAEPMMLALLRLGAEDGCLAAGNRTPFQECVRMGFNQIIEYYVNECGEDLRQKTADGKTLLEIARKEPTKRLLRSLMDEAQIEYSIKQPPMPILKAAKPLFAM